MDKGAAIGDPGRGVITDQGEIEGSELTGVA